MPGVGTGDHVSESLGTTVTEPRTVGTPEVGAREGITVTCLTGTAAVAAGRDAGTAACAMLEGGKAGAEALDLSASGVAGASRREAELLVATGAPPALRGVVGGGPLWALAGEAHVGGGALAACGDSLDVSNLDADWVEASRPGLQGLPEAASPHLLGVVLLGSGLRKSSRSLDRDPLLDE